MLATITSGFNALITMSGTVVNAIFGAVADGSTSGSWGAILPVVGISVGMTIVGFGIATVKNLIGRY